MIIILLYIFFFLFISFILREKKYFRAQEIICFMGLFIFFGFRDLPVLNDTGHYYEGFLYVASDKSYLNSSVFSIDVFQRFEPGFQMFEKTIAKYISKDPYSIIIISSLISSIVLLYLIKFFTHKLALAIFFLLGTSLMFYYYNNIRQGFACYLFWLGIVLFIKKNRNFKIVKIKWTLLLALLCILAVTFHYSAIVLFAPILLSRLSLNKKNVCLIITIGLLFCFSTYYLMRITGLSEVDYYDRGLNRETASFGPLLNAVMQIILAYVSFHLTKKYNIVVVHPIIWWVIILACIFSAASVLNGIIGRFAMYFSIFTIVNFVCCLERTPAHYRHIIKNVLVVILFIRVYILLEYRPEWNHLYPYSFYDFSKPYHEYRIYDEN